MPSSNSFRFGPFCFDAASGDLRRDGHIVRLRRQTAVLLAALIERDGSVLSREEITALLWPDNVHVDTESGINFVVRQLRTALGDDAAVPRYVETLPRRGYRLLVPAVPEPIAVCVAPIPADGPRIRARSGWAHWPGWMAAAIALLVLAAPQPHRPRPRLLVEVGTNAAGSRHCDREGLRDLLIAELDQPTENVDLVASQVADSYLGRPFPEMQKALALDLLLHVSVQDADGLPRVHAKLVHAADGRIIWSLNHDYPSGSLKTDSRAFAEQIAGAVRKALSL